MEQGLAIMRELQKLEQQLNAVNNDAHHQYQAGYFDGGTTNSYFYVNNYETYNDIFGTSFFVIIMQTNGKITYGGSIPNRTKRKIVEKFQHKLYKQFRIGKTSVPYPRNIELHTDAWSDYSTEDCLHPKK